jgi:hypothetical protein
MNRKAMNHRFLHQAAALIATVLLVVMLTLAAARKVDWLWFWGVAIVSLGLVYAIRKK